MALTTFNPPIGPSPGTTLTPQISLWSSEFGDGYSAAAPKGINHIRQTVSLKWDGLEEAQAKAIIAFFTARGGYQPFYYKPYGLDVTLKWTCKDWSMTASAPFKVTAKLEQSFTNDA